MCEQPSVSLRFRLTMIDKPLPLPMFVQQQYSLIHLHNDADSLYFAVATLQSFRMLYFPLMGENG